MTIENLIDKIIDMKFKNMKRKEFEKLIKQFLEERKNCKCQDITT